MADTIQAGDSASEVRKKLNAMIEQSNQASMDAISLKGEISAKVENLQTITETLQSEKVFLSAEEYETLENENKIDEAKMYYIIEE